MKFTQKWGYISQLQLKLENMSFYNLYQKKNQIIKHKKQMEFSEETQVQNNVEVDNTTVISPA